VLAIVIFKTFVSLSKHNLIKLETAWWNNIAYCFHYLYNFNLIPILSQRVNELGTVTLDAYFFRKKISINALNISNREPCQLIKAQQ